MDDRTTRLPADSYRLKLAKTWVSKKTYEVYKLRSPVFKLRKSLKKARSTAASGEIFELILGSEFKKISQPRSK